MFENDFSPQQGINEVFLPQTRPKIKNKQTYQIDLARQTFNFQIMKRNNAHTLKFLPKQYIFKKDVSQALFNAIQSIQNMQELYLDGLKDTWFIKKNKRLIHLSQSLKNLSCLQTISLRFSDCRQMTDSDLYEISQGLQRVSGLKTLILEFLSCLQFTDKGIYELSQSLSRLNSLQEFTLKLSLPNMITPKGLEYLLKSLKRFRSLSSFSLALTEWPGLRRAFMGLSKAIGGLVSLECLNLDFSPYVNFSSLGECFKGLKALKTLSLKFQSRDLTMDGGLKDFSKGLKELGGLENLRLDFSGFHELTDLSLGYICEALSKASNMQDINLNFSRCHGITDTGLNSISEVIKEFPCLTLSLWHFQKNSKISAKMTFIFCSKFFCSANFYLLWMKGTYGKLQLILSCLSMRSSNSMIILISAMKKPKKVLSEIRSTAEEKKLFL